MTHRALKTDGRKDNTRSIAEMEEYFQAFVPEIDLRNQTDDDPPEVVRYEFHVVPTPTLCVSTGVVKV